MISLVCFILSVNELSPRKPDLPPMPPVHFTLTDNAGGRRTVIVQSLEGGMLGTLDLDGHRRSEPVTGLLMLARAAQQPVSPLRMLPATNEATSTEPRALLFTIDGQIIPGEPSVGPRAADTVFWENSQLGSVKLPLDMLSRISSVQSAATNAAKVTQDTLYLHNGDRLAGFVESVGSEVEIETKSGSAKQKLTVPLDRIDTLILAQPARAPSQTLLASRAGMVLNARSITIKNRTVQFQPGLNSSQSAVNIPDEQLESLVFNADVVRPFTMCTISEPSALAGRTWSMPLEIRGMSRGPFAGEVEFPGPLSVQVTLPARAVKFMCSLELPHACRAWGDPTFVVSQIDAGGMHELQRVSLTGESPSAELIVPLSGSGALQLTVEAGNSGPIQDRVILRNGVFVLTEAAVASPGKTQ